MLSIFKSYEEKTSILDDFYYYDDRETKMQERRLRQNGVKAQPQQNQVKCLSEIMCLYPHTCQLIERIEAEGISSYTCGCVQTQWMARWTLLVALVLFYFT